MDFMNIYGVLVVLAVVAWVAFVMFKEGGQFKDDIGAMTRGRRRWTVLAAVWNLGAIAFFLWCLLNGSGAIVAFAVWIVGMLIIGRKVKQ